MSLERIRRGFSRIEAAAVIALLAVSGSLLAAASTATRARMSLGESIGNLKRLTDSMSASAADHQDLFATFTWKAGNTESQWADLRNAGSDMDAAACQAVDIIRRRANYPTFPRQTSWIPHVMHNYHVLVDYLDTTMPVAMVVSPEDANLLKWASNPMNWQQSGAPNVRAPFWSSYELPAAFWDGNALAGGGNAISQSSSHNTYYIPGGASLGGRRYSEVAYPSRKVMYFDRWQRHFGPRVGFALYDEARVPSSAVDGSVDVRATANSNRGWNPSNPTLLTPMYFDYTPASYEPARLQGVSSLVAGHFRWTRKGPAGVDFDGKEP